MSPEDPFKDANTDRGKIKDALVLNVPLTLIVNSKTTSFLLGLPFIDVEKLAGKSLTVEGKNGYQIWRLNTTPESAKQLFVSWSENTDPDIEKTFTLNAYDLIYKFTQATHQGNAKYLALGAPGLILDALVETGKPEYQFLEGMREYVAGKGEIEEDDKDGFARLLTSLWEKMDSLDRSTRYEPRLAFQ
jgi:hypothetical protein